jgi:hypothetical protein
MRLGHSYLPFIGIVDSLQGDVFVVVKGAVELGMVSMVSELGMQKVDIGSDQCRVT